MLIVGKNIVFFTYFDHFVEKTILPKRDKNYALIFFVVNDDSQLFWTCVFLCMQAANGFLKKYRLPYRRCYSMFSIFSLQRVFETGMSDESFIFTPSPQK